MEGLFVFALELVECDRFALEGEDPPSENTSAILATWGEVKKSVKPYGSNEEIQSGGRG